MADIDMVDTETLAAACRTAAVSSAFADLLNAAAARLLAMLSWIDGAKVDMAALEEAAAKATTWHMEALDDLAACVAERDEARAEVERLRTLADDNWRSLEREATEHARTQTAADRLLAEAAAHLRAIGVPKRGEPLSEGEQARFSAAIERGLRKRAEDLAEDLEARGLDLAASNAALTAERDDWRRRYEALRDGVTGLCDDPMSDWTALMGPCEKHTAQSGFMRKDDLRAVVARVEES